MNEQMTGGSLIIDGKEHWVGKTGCGSPYKIKSGDIDYEYISEEEYTRLSLELNRQIVFRNLSNSILWNFPWISSDRAMDLADEFTRKLVDEASMVLG